FNKSHSTCYALVAYQTAYLKAHYPSEYMAAVLNNANSIDKITFFMEECRSMGLKVLGPDVNESLKGFAVNKEGVVRFGMGAIKGVGEAAVEDILAERKREGAFASVFDLVKRVNQRTVNKKSIENIVLAGGFDSFKEMHRAQYFHTPPGELVNNLEKIIRFGNQYQADAQMNTNSLFGAMQMPEVKPPDIPNCTPWLLPELLEKEKEVVGIYLSAHPLDGYKFEMENYGFSPINDLENRKNRVVRIAGFVSDARELYTKKGDLYGRCVLNDYSGKMELTFWKENFVKFGDYLKDGQKIMITGKYAEMRFRPGVWEFEVQSIVLLEQVRRMLTKKISMRMPLHKLDPDTVRFFSENLQSNPGSTEFTFQVADLTTMQSVGLRSSAAKIQLNDELVQYLNEHDYIEYSVEVN
ncbi:MAG: DNA polymerase III subunit alpha, partial [Chitinophagaceae bacterium]|nr:DNA polymerase III subunit alpha [Chitinophagaceae bacterium]